MYSLLFVAWVGCGDPVHTAPVPSPVLEDLSTEVLRDLGEATSYASTGQFREAYASWLAAYAIFETHLETPIRDVDPHATLMLEYDFGRFGNSLQGRNADHESLQLAVENGVIGALERVGQQHFDQVTANTP